MSGGLTFENDSILARIQRILTGEGGFKNDADGDAVPYMWTARRATANISNGEAARAPQQKKRPDDAEMGCTKYSMLSLMAVLELVRQIR